MVTFLDVREEYPVPCGHETALVGFDVLPFKLIPGRRTLLVSLVTDINVYTKYSLAVTGIVLAQYSPVPLAGHDVC